MTYEDLTFIGDTKFKLLEWLKHKNIGQPGGSGVVHMGHKSCIRNSLYDFKVAPGWETSLTTWPNAKFEKE